MVDVMAFLPLNELPALFPHVVDWISYLEKQAQESFSDPLKGRPISGTVRRANAVKHYLEGG